MIRGSMRRGRDVPHYRCTRCKVRLDEAGSQVALVDEGCPICLGPLSHVSRLSELVGFRKVGRDDDLVRALPAPAIERAPAELGNARLARALVHELGWVDEEGSVGPRSDGADTWPERPR
jgi:hypothetical protein